MQGRQILGLSLHVRISQSHARALSRSRNPTCDKNISLAHAWAGFQHCSSRRTWSSPLEQLSTNVGLHWQLHGPTLLLKFNQHMQRAVAQHTTSLTAFENMAESSKRIEDWIEGNPPGKSPGIHDPEGSADPRCLVDDLGTSPTAAAAIKLYREEPSAAKPKNAEFCDKSLLRPAQGRDPISHLRKDTQPASNASEAWTRTVLRVRLSPVLAPVSVPGEMSRQSALDGQRAGDNRAPQHRH